MATSPTFDADKLRASSQHLRDAAAIYAGKVAVRAADLAGQGVDWAAPRAQAALHSAIEHATPAIENAAARAQAAAAQAVPAIENAREQLVDDYLTRASLAVDQAGAALSARGSLSERARRASEASAVALATPVRKRRKCRVLRAFGLTALVGAVAGAGYILWKRSQPIEDPWAEEYWADLDTDSFVPDTEPPSRRASDSHLLRGLCFGAATRCVAAPKLYPAQMKYPAPPPVGARRGVSRLSGSAPRRRVHHR